MFHRSWWPACCFLCFAERLVFVFGSAISEGNPLLQHYPTCWWTHPGRNLRFFFFACELICLLCFAHVVTPNSHWAFFLSPSRWGSVSLWAWKASFVLKVKRIIIKLHRAFSRFHLTVFHFLLHKFCFQPQQAASIKRSDKSEVYHLPSPKWQS